MKVFIIQQERCGFRWKTQHQIRVSVLKNVPVDDNDSDDLEVFCRSFIYTMTIQFRVPFIAGALGRIEPKAVLWAFENSGTVRAGALAHIWRQHIADAR